MKAGQNREETNNDECDDIFGPPRTEVSAYAPPKSRPLMISEKYRQKEERRKVLKISINKLKKIEDPEVSLCRSVLINNTMKRLQREAKDEKEQKQQLNYVHYDSDGYLNLKNENELKSEPQDFASNEEKYMDTLEAHLENGFGEKVEEVAQFSGQNSDSTFNGSELTEPVLSADENVSRKKIFEDLDEDVQDVLWQFYMPQTPRMITSIDEDEDDEIVVDDEPAPKRKKQETNPMDTSDPLSITTRSSENFCNGSQDPTRLNYAANVDDSNSYSCGQSLMLNDLQTNVYHSLIASLET